MSGTTYFFSTFVAYFIAACLYSLIIKLFKLNTVKIEYELSLPEGCKINQNDLKFATDGSSGVDVRAVIGGNKDYITVPPHHRVSVDTGVKFRIPKGYELQVRPRSGLSSKNVDVELGTIDSDYRGTVRIILTNNDRRDLKVQNGMRIGQIICAKLPKVGYKLVPKGTIKNTETKRGSGGFGSTGTH